ncbi:hypothetical protein [Caulobacter sp. NIBR1757]|uniref:hypothetical protein n=1 Tax=Caulobacter sp. NIBR1757 TaxID=3016000 RepID=UPI0022F1390F|nr:hypothetical protein [Caulobacter sp. NIBR1757]WGM41210.1 hypothetical protein AMEJIAPC_04160 [Caulobacter sp. NIBR1757]
MIKGAKGLILAFCLAGLGGCHTVARLEDEHGSIRDTDRQFAIWVAGVDEAVAAERAGRPPMKLGSQTWPEHWGARIGSLRGKLPNGYPTTQNAERYVAYIHLARERAGLPPLTF